MRFVAFEFECAIIERTVGRITNNYLWLTDVLPNLMVGVLFIALAVYSVVKL